MRLLLSEPIGKIGEVACEGRRAAMTIFAELDGGRRGDRGAWGDVPDLVSSP
jgi:hypothetical protein